MKRLLSLLLVFSVLFSSAVFAEGYDEDDLSIEEIVEEVDLDEEDGEELADDDLSDYFQMTEEEENWAENLSGMYELQEAPDAGSLYINENLPNDVINILLIGVDARGTKKVQKLSDQMRRSDDEPKDKSVPKRSDVLMILSVNLNDGSIKLTSIARNTYVEVPDRKNKTIIANSFGHAIYKNGNYQSWIDTPEMCVATVNKNFQMNIKYYVALNFFGVEEIIEYLGGVDIDLTKKEATAINTYLSLGTIYQKQNGKKVRVSHGKEIANTYDNHSANRKKLDKKDGVQHLDGLQALMYARLRHIDNDFVRTARVRHLLDSLLKQTMQRIKSKDKKTRLDLFDLISEFIAYPVTNIDAMTMIELASKVVSSDIMNHLDSATTLISEFRVPEDGTYSYATVDGSSVTVMNNKQKTVESIHNFIYGKYYAAD